MKTPPLLLKVLEILAARYGMSCSLEELSQLASPAVNNSIALTAHLASEIENQVAILDILLLLNDQGLIFLNPDSDRSVITIKGLIKVNHKILCN